MKKLWRAILIFGDFLLLALTLRPTSMEVARGWKVFGRVNFEGGPSSKLTHLRELLAGRLEGFSHLICLSAIRTPLFLLVILKRFGARVFVNQNGVYYPQWMPVGYKEKNLFLFKLNQIAVHSFFQSEFAFDSYIKWVGPAPKSYSILYNPVDLARFFPKRDSRDSSQKMKILLFHDLTPTSLNLWRFLVSLFRDYSGETSKYDWMVVGRWGGVLGQEEIKLLESHPNISFHWNPSNDELPSLLANNQSMLYLRYNDVCPNKVLEALACGLPVVCLSAGGTKELVADAGVILPVLEHYDAPAYPEPLEIFEALERVNRQRVEFSNRAIERAAMFSLEKWQDEIRSQGNIRGKK